VRLDGLLVLVEERQQVRALLRLFKAGEDHLGARDVILGLDEVRDQVLTRPDNATGLLGGGEIVVGMRTSLLAPQTPEIGALSGGPSLDD